MAVMTNRLRTEGTDHLLAAGRAVGARRFVAQSFGAFRWASTGGPVLTEADPLDPDPPAALRAGARRHPPSSSGRCRRSSGARVSCCATAVSTVRGPRSAWLRTRRWRRRSASADSRSSATAVASGRTFTSTTPRPRPSPRSMHGAAGDLQHRRRRARAGAGVAAGAGERARRQATEAHPALAGAARGG